MANARENAQSTIKEKGEMNGSGNLKSGRIALRRWRESDVDALFALASEPVVGEMAKFPVHADRAESLRVIHEIFCRSEFYAVTSSDGDTVLGSISLHPAVKGLDVYEAEELIIGYWMGRPYWGKGFMTEAVKALCERCRSSGMFRCRRIIGYTNRENAGSRRVMEKAGFRLLETMDAAVRYAFDVVAKGG